MERTLFVSELTKRISENRKFIQVVAGPRQVGKTTIISHFLKNYKYSYISESADAVTVSVNVFIEQIWNNARMMIKNGETEVLIVIDEVQKLSNWSENVKKFWDEDSKNGTNIKVILSGSSRLLIEKGLTESLQGRFELIHIPHWTFSEMQEAFGFTLDEYIYFGGYPGSAELIKDEKRWKNYIKDSIIETSISKDIIMLTSIAKPALLRQLFDLGTVYSSQILPFNKMLGTLTDAGNTVTIAHYLELLDQCGLLGGIQKYSGSEQRTRSSSPKLQVYNNALFSAVKKHTFSEAKNTPDLWGRFTESCAGCHLINNSVINGYKLNYWRDGNDEVDFVISDGSRTAAIEVKSGARFANKGMELFKKKYPEAKIYVVSSKDFPSASGIDLETFLNIAPEELL
ncbi:ATP-binding protein [Treponema sp.]|uniref:ATP-binding protein n=1 Tax=Treponema sp. TaxID=166 RepID=UPI003F10ACC5